MESAFVKGIDKQTLPPNLSSSIALSRMTSPGLRRHFDTLMKKLDDAAYTVADAYFGITRFQGKSWPSCVSTRFTRSEVEWGSSKTQHILKETVICWTIKD